MKKQERPLKLSPMLEDKFVQCINGEGVRPKQILWEKERTI